MSEDRDANWSSRPGWLTLSLILAALAPLLSLVLIIPGLVQEIGHRHRAGIAVYAVAFFVSTGADVLLFMVLFSVAPA